MCGILGLVAVPRSGDADAALASIFERGPDARELREIAPGVTFGFARLAIIDLAGGSQPMTTADGRYTIAYNGEIYNFEALREDLMRKGVKFRTRSDTEVLLEGYAREGADFIKRADGMFAFAIWDSEAKKLFCARDPVGVKPFFYAEGAAASGGFIFASTLAPFLRLRNISRELDFEAVRDFLAFQTPLAPHSFLKAVRQLPPAHRLIWERGKPPKVERYWSIPHASASQINREELIEATDAALQESVRRQLVSDVPIGAFLSGGIDSSLVVHYMAQAGAKPLKTFSVGFDEKAIDESPIAREVAEKYGTDHTEFRAAEISGDMWIEHVSKLDQPLADPSYVPLAALAKLTRQSVTVALSGDGGDELFGGYGRFLDTEDSFPGSSLKKLMAALIGAGLAPGALTRRSLAGRAMVNYRKVELGDYPRTRKDISAYLTKDAYEAANPKRTLQRWHELIAEFGGKATTDAMMRADIWTYLSENCLVKTDRASMAASLEARVPILGKPVLDLILKYPAQVHFDPKGKALLRAIACRHLPESVWGRKKQGFTVPLENYFNGVWRERADDLVSRAQELAPWLDSGAVRRLWQDARKKRASRRLMYSFLVLFIWLDRWKFSA